MTPERLVEAFERDGALLLTNSRRPYPREAALRKWLGDQEPTRNGVVFQTSGSEATPRFVSLSRDAVRFSCAAVNRRLRVAPDDVWLGVLPLYHVGGFCIPIRARLAGADCRLLSGAWSPGRFIDACEDAKATLTSLVPTQLYDLVEGGGACPASLRAVLVGGDTLAPVLRKRALRLGWPLLETYGMTETASQVATELLDPAGGRAEERPWLTLLDGWQIDTAGNSLGLRGPALFSGYVAEDGESFRWIDPRVNGWFTTRDVVEREGARLRFVSRDRHMLKIHGELVNLLSCRERLAALAGVRQRSITVVPLEDLRSGIRLVAVGEATAFSKSALESLRQAFNAERPRYEHLTAAILTRHPLPRTDLGKLEEASLTEAIRKSLPGARESNTAG